ncbi:MAG TPA: hypothetical protein VFC19_54675 [Candidatus Limnocylindrales bacterium]|nr:hypothetical protein [Candidatus Limnocylindrales bacterium]
MTPPVLELRDVRKVYPGTPAVESIAGVSLTVHSGEFVAVPADEPTGNLDIATGAALLALLAELNAEGTTILVITHDPGVAAVSRRRIELRDGCIVRDSVRHDSGVLK